MNKMTTENMLVRRGFLLAHPSLETDQMAAYYTAKILNTFGILVDKPNLVTRRHVEVLSELFNEFIPESFYDNPQDLKHFTRFELAVEQLVSYLQIEINGVFSEDEEVFDRVEIFKKVLPNYKEGEEVEFRNYQILTFEEVSEKMFEIADNLRAYTRPFSETERDEFLLLFNSGYIDADRFILASKDNSIEMLKLTENSNFSKGLDQKDVVKLSVDLVGLNSRLTYSTSDKKLLLLAMSNCREVPLTRKQAKFWNSMKRALNLKINDVNNDKSPYKAAVRLVKEGRVVDAAKVFAKHGSLLERNLTWLLSRARPNEISMILELMKVNNPIVAVQLLQTLTKDTQGPRTFKFHHNRMVKSHTETEQETKFRKSVLSQGTKDLVHEFINEKIDDYYRNLPKLGKVYISDMFKTIPLPFNTSSAGTGIDVYPAGTRLPITEDYVRAFTHWEDIYDVDFSMLAFKENGDPDSLGYWNYSNKPFGHDALHSGDERSNKGAEFIDIKLDNLRELGYKHLIFSVNSFQGRFNRGLAHVGLQYKKDLETKAWSPKNIKFQNSVSGESSSMVSFAIDLTSSELIVINQMVSSASRTLNPEDLDAVKHYLNGRFVTDFNVAKLARLRAEEIVDNPEDADVVFDRTYVQVFKEAESSDSEEVVEVVKQSIIRPFDIEKIVALMK